MDRRECVGGRAVGSRAEFLEGFYTRGVRPPLGFHGWPPGEPLMAGRDDPISQDLPDAWLLFHDTHGPHEPSCLSWLLFFRPWLATDPSNVPHSFVLGIPPSSNSFEKGNGKLSLSTHHLSVRSVCTLKLAL